MAIPIQPQILKGFSEYPVLPGMHGLPKFFYTRYYWVCAVKGLINYKLFRLPVAIVYCLHNLYYWRWSTQLKHWLAAINQRSSLSKIISTTPGRRMISIIVSHVSMAWAMAVVGMPCHILI
jgi:hypothetical protein